MSTAQRNHRICNTWQFLAAQPNLVFKLFRFKSHVDQPRPCRSSENEQFQSMPSDDKEQQIQLQWHHLSLGLVQCYDGELGNGAIRSWKTNFRWRIGAWSRIYFHLTWIEVCGMGRARIFELRDQHKVRHKAGLPLEGDTWIVPSLNMENKGVQTYSRFLRQAGCTFWNQCKKIISSIELVGSISKRLPLSTFATANDLKHEWNIPQTRVRAGIRKQ